MVHKETCPTCNGERFVKVTVGTGETRHKKCPSCAGNGYRVRVTHGKYC